MTFPRPMLFALSLVVMPWATNAQQSDEAWQSDCKADLCTITRGLVDASTGRSVATFIAVLQKDAEALRLGVALPLGTALDAGVRFVAGDTTIDMPFQVCFPDGCRALSELKPDQEAALVAAETLDIRFFPFSSETPVAVEVPLAGLSDVLKTARASLKGE